MTTAYQFIRLERSPGVLRITVDRPPLNVLDIATMVEIGRALEEVDSSVKVVVFAGQGRAFSAGVDIKDHTPDRVEEMLQVFHAIFRRMVVLPQVTVAAIQGATLGGGCELALFCDLVVAAESARLGQPEIKVGVFPPIAVISLPRLVGRKKALELILTGESLDAREAWRLGLVNQVVPDDQLPAATTALVDKLTALSGPVLAATKKALRQGLDTDFEAVLGRVEDIYLKELMALPDAVEGLQAFLEKRPPVWQQG